MWNEIRAFDSKPGKNGFEKEQDRYKTKDLINTVRQFRPRVLVNSYALTVLSIATL